MVVEGICYIVPSLAHTHILLLCACEKTRNADVCCWSCRCPFPQKRRGSCTHNQLPHTRHFTYLHHHLLLSPFHFTTPRVLNNHNSNRAEWRPPPLTRCWVPNCLQFHCQQDSFLPASEGHNIYRSETNQTSRRCNYIW